MITFFIILFAFVSILYFMNIKHNVVSTIVFMICGLVLILVAGLREKGIDKDYFIYKDFWLMRNLKENVEYSFYIIRNFLKYYLGLKYQSILFVYAILGVTFKLLSIQKISPLIWGSLLIYFSNYYILHEFTQIRIGVATGFLLLSLYYLIDKKYIHFYVFAGIAIFFHQSCFFIIIFPLFQNTERNIKFYYWVVPIGYLFYFFNTYLNFKIPIPSLQEKIDLYELATESGWMKDEKSNVFNALLLIRIAILNALLFYSKKIAEYFPGVFLFVKIYSFSLFSYMFLSKIPVFAVRIQELLGVVEIVLIPCLIFIFAKQFRYLGIILVWAIALVFFLMNIYYVKLILVK